jgi:signal transduction histidine kinase/ActR/RegA family two-component response regulator
MFGWLARLHSFGEKLTWLLTLTSGGAIVGVCTALALLDYFNLRHEAISALESHTMIVAMNSGAPLAFDDRASAAEALAAFRVRPGVVEATLFDIRGRPFERYARADAEDSPALSPQPIGSHDFGRWHVLSVPIEERDLTLGRLQLLYDLQYTHARLWRNLTLSALVTAVAVLLVYLFSRRIRDVVMRPIASLDRTAQQVSSTRDYSLRAQKVSHDELGTFTDTFNEMLAQIQKQDFELQAARHEAELANRLKDEFLATLSHELRTPLTPILGWAQILQRIAGDNPRLQQAAAVIERSARSQAQIVDDLLDMSRIISGKLRLDLQAVDIAAVVDAAIDTVRPAAEAKGVRVLSHPDPQSTSIRGDPNRLQQVIWNLLSNAIRFTERDGSVEVTTAFDPQHVTITVRDSGLGISSEFLPHVFERFRQADSSTTRAHGGLGIGLAIARQLVELHGGGLRANSPGIGHGATFTVLLPRVPPETAVGVTDAASAPGPRPPATHPQPAPALGGLAVLLVHSDREATAELGQWLGDAGAEVAYAGSAEEALHRLAQAVPDLLVCDTAMSGIDAFAFMRCVRQLPAEQGGAVPAIALTAFARSEERTRALVAGFQLHVAKPVEPGELRAAVASIAARGTRDSP